MFRRFTTNSQIIILVFDEKNGARYRVQHGRNELRA